MVLTHDELVACRDQHRQKLLPVLPIAEDFMSYWAKEEAIKYFESGGLFLPASCELPRRSPVDSILDREENPPPRAVRKPDGTPIPFLTSNTSVANPPPTRIAFIHGFGESVELVEMFNLEGLKKAFPGCKVDAIEGPYKLTKAEIKEHMVKGDLRDMALQGQIDLNSWVPADAERARGVDFSRGLDTVERRFVQAGGYDIIVGFSDGGNLAFQFINHLESLQASPGSSASCACVYSSAPTTRPSRGCRRRHQRSSGDSR